MEIENEPRSSLERDLMDRDREGQLYLETRRQRALVDLLDINRTSFLSTITPPSTNPPSAASSLFQEPLATPVHTEASATRSSPNTPLHSAERTSAAAEATASATNTTPSNTPATTTAIQNIIPAIKKKTRGRTLVPELENRPAVSISTSSLEYQLTANLLKLHHAPPSSSGTRSRSRSRSKPRLHKPRSATLSHDARIDTQAVIVTTGRGTGHARATRETTAKEQEVLQDDLEQRTCALTSVATPSSPSSRMFGPPSPFLPSSSEQNHAGDLVNSTGTVAPSVPRSPPLPPLPPKSPRSLIAHYFPGSLPPPPARCRPRPVQKNLVLAPRPVKTPTFGPAFASKSRVALTAPPLPSPSSSLQYIAALPPPAAAMDDTMSMSSPSPSISALGPTFSATSIEQPPRGLPSDLDLSISTSARARSHLQDQHHQQLYPMPHHSNNSSISVEDGRDLASMSLSLSSSSPFSVSFSNLADSEVLSGTRHSNNSNNDINNNDTNNNISSTKTTWASSSVIPIYPRDLMPITSANMSGSSNSNSMSLNLNSSGPQKPKPAVPYVRRELIPGQEDSPEGHRLAELLTTTTSPNTSRDLEMVLEEITGRIYTTRTSMGPWSSPLPAGYFQDDNDNDEKSLPPIRREKGSRYWVFRTADGDIVPGPFLFLLGHLCPVLWWIGSVYPSIEHPDYQHRHHQQQHQKQRAVVVSSRSRKNSVASIGSEKRLSDDEPMSLAAQAGTTQDLLAENPVVQWLQRHLRAAGVRIASITTTARSSSPCPSSSSSTSRPPKTTTHPEQMATLQVVRISQEVPDRDSESPDEAGLPGHMSNNSSWIHVPARLLFPPLSTTTTAAGAAAGAHAHHIATTMTTTMPMMDDGLDTHGPWSAEDNAAYLFELRMARDRKLLRYELDLSWRRINLIWSLGSFVLALTITAIVLTAT
ncbi:hypothetical protein BGZ67_010205 [Mortierella alpina]|nr:hypothetical protein BGZ67_010205 [Mortierella alpina]